MVSIPCCQNNFIPHFMLYWVNMVLFTNQSSGLFPRLNLASTAAYACNCLCHCHLGQMKSHHCFLLPHHLQKVVGSYQGKWSLQICIRPVCALYQLPRHLAWKKLYPPIPAHDSSHAQTVEPVPPCWFPVGPRAMALEVCSLLVSLLISSWAYCPNSVFQF